VGNEAKDVHSKDFSIVNGAVQELKPCKLYDDDDDDDEIEQLPAMCDSKSSSYINKHVPKYGGTAVAQWLRCCATNRKVAGSIPASVTGFFIDIKFFRSHYGPGVDSASGGKGGRCVPPSCAIVMKYGNLNFLEPFGPVLELIYLYPIMGTMFKTFTENSSDLPCVHYVYLLMLVGMGSSEQQQLLWAALLKTSP